MRVRFRSDDAFRATPADAEESRRFSYSSGHVPLIRSSIARPLVSRVTTRALLAIAAMLGAACSDGSDAFLTASGYGIRACTECSAKVKVPPSMASRITQCPRCNGALGPAEH